MQSPNHGWVQRLISGTQALSASAVQKFMTVEFVVQFNERNFSTSTDDK